MQNHNLAAIKSAEHYGLLAYWDSIPNQVVIQNPYDRAHPLRIASENFKEIYPERLLIDNLILEQLYAISHTQRSEKRGAAIGRAPNAPAVSCPHAARTV